MFKVDGVVESVSVDGVFCSNGEVVQEWALAGCGIALKSFWDVESDLAEGRLVELLRDYTCERADIYALYPRQEKPAGPRENLPRFFAEIETGRPDAAEPFPSS